MKKTRIVCTMGPNTENLDTLRALMENGMDVARFNFSHGSYESHKAAMDNVKKLRRELNKNIAILLDTKGPEIRTKFLKNHEPVTLKEGQTFTLTTEELEGDDTIVSVTYEDITADVSEGNRVLIDDGLIELKVDKKTDKELVCTVLNGGTLGERKGVNVPNVVIHLPLLTEKDKEDLKFGVEQDIDYIAASFVRNAEGILQIKSYLKELGAPYIPIIAKIENVEAVRNIDEIIRAADGIMVARGDLGVEMAPEEVPHIQKEIIHKCREHFKPVITATQMLDSMIRNPRPTRAEVTDVANAVYDGTDAVMLSGETSVGKYPIDTLKMMVKIVESTESRLDYDRILEMHSTYDTKNVSSAVAYSSVFSAARLKTKVIIAPSISGATTRVISKLRPKQIILGMTPNERALRRMALYWGVREYKTVPFKTTEDICEGAVELAMVKEFVEKGDVVVLTAGIPSVNVTNEKASVSNMMQIVTV